MRPKYLGLLAMAGIVTGSAIARADNFNYPGVICQPENGGTYEMNYGSVLNASSTSDLNVVCPILKNGSGTFTSIGPDSAVTFIDRNSTLDVACELRSESFSQGNVVHNGSFVITSAGISGQGNKQLGLTGNGGDYYYLFCTIPRMSNGAKSGIVFFHIVEH